MLTEPTHVYVDLDMVNNDQTTNDDPPHLRFEETRNAPYIEGDTSDYFCSILRFSIQTGNSLPIFIPRVLTGQTDPNRTVYSVTVRKSSGETFTVPLAYVPWNLAAPTPQPPLTKQDLSSDYYFVHSYNHFLSMLNAALMAAHSQAFPGTDFENSLFVQFDHQTNLFVLYCRQSHYDAPDPVTGYPLARVYFNTRLYQLLSTLPARFLGNAGELNYQISVTDIHNTENTDFYDSSGNLLSTCVPVYQEISTVATWNPVASVVFCTSFIPVHPTHTSPPRLFGDGSTQLTSQGENANISSILTDFEVSVSDTNQYRPNITMNPQAEFRLIDMNSVTNLNKIDLIVYWKTHYGELIPLRLLPGCAAHIKIMFRHKRFNESS